MNSSNLDLLRSVSCVKDRGGYSKVVFEYGIKCGMQELNPAKIADCSRGPTLLGS